MIAPADRPLVAPTAAHGRLAYVTKMFPRVTETFVLSEVLALRRQGIPLQVYSLLPPVRDARMHPEAEALLDEVRILPEMSLRSVPAVWGALRRLFRAHPFRTAAHLLRGFLHLSPSGIRSGTRGFLLADRLLRDDISHVHAAWAHTPATVAEAASRLTGIPWSMAAHAKDIYTSRPDSLARRMASARFTLACSVAHADHLRQVAAMAPGGRSADVILAHHGVDTDFFSPAESPTVGDSIPRIVSIGRLVPKKGMDHLLEAAGRLRDRGVPFHLEIIGEGPLRARLELAVRELRLTEHVALPGLRFRDEVRDALRGAACFVLACRVDESGDRDGIPNSIAEAMACSVPIVATRVPGIEELVVDGCGALVPAGDVQALADALERTLRDPERPRIGSRARARVLECFDARRCEAERTRLLAESVGVQRVLYLSADRGVPIRGTKGASVHVRSLVRALEERGAVSVVVTTNAGPAQSAEPSFRIDEARAEGRLAAAARLMARVLAPWPWGRADRSGARASAERAFLRLADNVVLFRTGAAAARSWRPDAVYERYSLSAVAGWLLARRLGVPHVLEVNAPLADEEARHRGLALPRLTRALEGWILRGADRVLVVSEALKGHAERLGVEPGRIVVVPNGVDPALFHPGRDGGPTRNKQNGSESVLVGFSGSLKPWHGVEHLVRALATAANEEPRLRLLVLGDGPERRPLLELVRELGVEDRVEFAGAVRHEHVPEYLAACDILSAPYGASSDFYFSPLKVAEYRAVGKPVIASRVGDLGRSLDERSGVVLVEPGDEAALARTLIGLARDPETRARLGRAAAESPWTWSHVADATLLAVDAARPVRWRWASCRPLTIAYVVKMFPRFSETFIVNEILELERLGVKVVIFSMKAPNEPVRQPAVARVRAAVRVLPALGPGSRGLLVRAHMGSLLRHPIRYVRTLAFAKSRKSESAWSKFLLAAWVAREARARGIDHLHAHFASGPARQAKLASMLSGIPFSFTAHAKDLYWSGHRHEERHKLKKRLRLAAFVVAISEQNRRFLENLGFHVPRRKVMTIHNGIDVEAWPYRRTSGRPILPHSNGDARPLVLAVGRLVEKKGFHVLIEALAQLRERGIAVRAWIAGDGPEKDRLKGLIRGLGLGETVRLLGSVPQDRLIAMFDQAHVLAQPCVVAADGDQDGIPTVLLEAMAVGLPVVTTDLSGIPEAVRDGVSGLTVPSGDVETFADAIARVIADDALAARLAAQARQTIEERFDLHRSARDLVQLFHWSAHESWRPRERAR
jgi:glycosyltransferase involved in cell wall biosynthesis